MFADLALSADLPPGPARPYRRLGSAHGPVMRPGSTVPSATLLDDLPDLPTQAALDRLGRCRNPLTHRRQARGRPSPNADRSKAGPGRSTPEALRTMRVVRPATARSAPKRNHRPTQGLHLHSNPRPGGIRPPSPTMKEQITTPPPPKPPSEAHRDATQEPPQDAPTNRTGHRPPEDDRHLPPRLRRASAR